MKRIYVPSNSPEDWKCLLADPNKQWKSGCSAKALANEWESTVGFPNSISNVFNKSEYKEINSLELLFLFPEYKVSLPGGIRPSQNDVYVLARNSLGLMSIMVEGKVEESFDEKVSKWAENVSNGIDNIRLQFLIDKLELNSKKDKVLNIRYQLLHRTVSALLEAERVGASQAMMLVHSFSSKDSWFSDYKEFLDLFGIIAKVNEVHNSIKVNNVDLFFAWVKGDGKFLA